MEPLILSRLLANKFADIWLDGRHQTEVANWSGLGFAEHMAAFLETNGLLKMDEVDKFLSKRP